MCRSIQFLVAILLSPLAQADCVVQSASTRPHLIELYSSEGCSSCPPAETWLRGIHNGAKAVALEFHVDYWDSLGWRDRFANARYTARQQAFALHAGSAGVYTPEVALDGREWRDWYRRAALSSPVSSSASMKLSVEPGMPLHARVETTLADSANASAYANYIALIEDGLSSQVRAGENRGTLLRHDHVVRAFIGPLSGANAEVTAPADLDWSHAALVAFAQRDRDGDIAQVVMLPLAQCHR